MTTADSVQEGATGLPRGGWTGRSRGGVIGNRIFLVFLKACGLRAAYALLVPVTFYYLFAGGKSVKASRDYLQRIFRRRFNPAEALFLTWRHFFRFGQVLLDRVAVISGIGKFEFTFDGEEYLKSALRDGKGLLLITAHAGNWEAAGHILSRLDTAVNVVAYEGEIEKIKRMFDTTLKNRFFRVIEVGDALKTGVEIISALGRGEIVAMHADRVVGSDFVRLDFLGSKANFPTGPYLAAILSAAPLVSAFVVRKGAYRYAFKAWRARYITVETRQERELVVREEAACFAGRLENVLRDNPYQWFNFYDFWGEDTVER